MKALLLENIHRNAVAMLQNDGFDASQEFSEHHGIRECKECGSVVLVCEAR